MGGENSKIDTVKIPVSEIRANSPTQQGKFCPPFRKFKNHQISINDRELTATLSVEQPCQQQISITQKYFEDLQDAFDSKTKDLQLISVLSDDQYVDVKTYLAKEKDKEITIQLKTFNNVNSYNFNNILYEMHMNEEIAKLQCPNLNTIEDRYIIETGLQVQGEENPNTQVFVLGPIATNLSEIIKYRRQNNWPWSTSQFNALASDLSKALTALHNANISHNDIRPFNVYYSLQKHCYQLGSFANAVRVQDKSAAVSQMRTSAYYGAPELSTSKQADFQQADIYSLGMTLLSAFYLCQPIDRKAVTDYNKKFESSYNVMGAIRQMVMPIDKRSSISTISARIPQGQSSQTMKHLISSLQYKNAPKDRSLISSKKQLSEAYQRLGLWNDWKNQEYQAFQMQQNTLDDFRKANSLMQLSKIESCRGQLESACQYAKSASKIYRGLGYNAYQQGNINQSLNLFTHATECSKYFQNRYDIQTAKNLQGLALAHSEKGDYQLCKPLIRQSIDIVVKNTGRDSIDYCRVLISEANIQSEFGQFENSEKLLNQCLSIAESKTKINEDLGLNLKAQILYQLGKNSLKWAQHSPPDKRPALIAKAEKNLADSILINEKFPNNHLVLAKNIDAFGQIDLAKQNFSEAKNNFIKAQELRDTFIRENQNVPVLHKETADTLCNIGACQSGLGNHAVGLKNCNDALEIYRRLYGSDHNKFSAMAIGNMSKIYYKLNDKPKAKQCLRVATQILKDELGDDDPDYEYFKHLQETL